jgi:hypothetical protein
MDFNDDDFEFDDSGVLIPRGAADDTADDAAKKPVIPAGPTPEEWQAQLKRVQELEAQVKNPPPAPAPAQVPAARPVIPAVVDRQQIIANLNKTFANDPGEYGFELLQAVDRIAEQKARAMVAPVNETATRAAIDNYKQAMSTDALFPQAEETFDRLIGELTPAALANVPADQIRKQLDNVYNMAVGESLRKKPNNIPAAPNYGGGSATGGVSKARKLSKNQQNVIALARQYGMSDKDAAAAASEAEAS